MWSEQPELPSSVIDRQPTGIDYDKRPASRRPLAGAAAVKAWQGFNFKSKLLLGTPHWFMFCLSV
jgi:hypothetical protein